MKIKSLRIAPTDSIEKIEHEDSSVQKLLLAKSSKSIKIESSKNFNAGSNMHDEEEEEDTNEEEEYWWDREIPAPGKTGRVSGQEKAKISRLSRRSPLKESGLSRNSPMKETGHSG